MPAKSIMIQGTASDVGKVSFVLHYVVYFQMMD